MIKRSLSVDATLFNRLQTGSEVLDLDIIKASSEPLEKYNLLINTDLLLRIEKKNRNKIRKPLLTSVVNSKNLVSSKYADKLRKICTLNDYIRDRIGLNTQRAYNSKDNFDDFYLLLQKRWDKMKELEKNLKLSLLRKDTIGYCEKCHAFRQANGLIRDGNSPRSKCFMCQAIIKINKTYYSLPEATAQYIGGFWLEDYISKKLQTLNWITATNIYIYGTSGVKFEIDILATKQGKTLIVECKTGGSGLNNLSSFLAKFYDIKTDLALFASLQKTGADMKSMVSRRKNFILLDHIKSDRDLIRRLKQI